MTLALPKTGLLDERAGELVLADIGIPEGVYRRAAIPYRTPFDRRTRVSLHKEPVKAVISLESRSRVAAASALGCAELTLGPARWCEVAERAIGPVRPG
jgi:hypothetical protein